MAIQQGIARNVIESHCFAFLSFRLWLRKHKAKAQRYILTGSSLVTTDYPVLSYGGAQSWQQLIQEWAAKWNCHKLRILCCTKGQICCCGKIFLIAQGLVISTTGHCLLHLDLINTLNLQYRMGLKNLTFVNFWFSNCFAFLAKFCPHSFWMPPSKDCFISTPVLYTVGQ